MSCYLFLCGVTHAIGAGVGNAKVLVSGMILVPVVISGGEKEG